MKASDRLEEKIQGKLDDILTRHGISAPDGLLDELTSYVVECGERNWQAAREVYEITDLAASARSCADRHL